MAVLQPTSAYFRYIALTMYCVEAGVVFLLLLIELRTFYYSVYRAKTYASQTISPKNSKSLESNSSSPSKGEPSQETAKLVFILPILSYVLYVLTGVCGCFSLLGIDACGWFVRAGPPCYYLAKMFMYLVFTYRLYIVYQDSAFAYNNKALLIVSVSIIIYTLGIISANGMTLQVHKLYNVNQQRLCIAFGNPLVLLMTIVMDAIISVLCCYLFIKPLLILKKANDNDATNKHAQGMYHLILKYLTLTFIAVITTFGILVLMVALKFTTLLTVDIIINCVCILLFNRFYDYYYKIICCGAIQICNKLCQSSRKRNDVEMMLK